MNEYTKNLERIEFVVTLACTGKCKHCSQGEHTNSGGHIDGSTAAEALRQLAAVYKINSVMTFGGEPLLYLDDVCKIHRAAKEMNIPERELITNGFFSKNENKIISAAERLAECGVNRIMLSADAFHQETIPIEPVKLFAECVKKTGIEIKVHPAYLVSCEDNNPYNLKTNQLIAEFSELGIESSSGNIIFPSGNALKHLSEYFKDNQTYVNPYKQDAADIRAISISPNGNVLSGNIYKSRIMDIIENYIPQ